MILRLAATTILFTSLSASGFASCSTPIYAPLTDDRQNWHELESLTADPSSNANIQAVQDIAGMGQGQINLDFYTISFDASGRSAAQVFADIRPKLNDLIFAGTSYSISPYSDADRDKWNSADPSGALMSFVLGRIPGIMDLERGSVVVSCYSETDMIFSTVKTEKDGFHPVAGNRAFGVYDFGNGRLAFYVKAADRVVNGGIFGTPAVNNEMVFELGHKIWLHMLENIKEQMAALNPSDDSFISHRVDY